MACLFYADIEVWNTRHPGKRVGVAENDLYILNSNRVIELREASDETSLFYYSNDPNDPRDAPDYIKTVTVGPAYIEGQRNAVAASKFGSLYIFPGYDITETAVETLIEWDDIAYIYATPRDTVDNVCHMVYYREAWERVECLVSGIPLNILGENTGVV